MTKLKHTSRGNSHSQPVSVLCSN